MLVVLIRLILKQDAVPDVPMRPEEPISRVARSRTVRQVMRGESFVGFVFVCVGYGFYGSLYCIIFLPTDKLRSVSHLCLCGIRFYLSFFCIQIHCHICVGVG